MGRIPADARDTLETAAAEAMAMTDAELQAGGTDTGYANVTFTVEGGQMDVLFFRTKTGDIHVDLTVHDDVPDFSKVGISAHDNRFIRDVVDELSTIIASAGGPGTLNLTLANHGDMAKLRGDTPV